MKTNTKRFAAIAAALLTLLPGALPAAQQFIVTKAQLDFFETKIRPVLAEHCYKCHSVTAEKIKGSLTLDTREGWLKGGDSGAAIVPGDVEKSLLIKAVRYTDADLQMPPKDRKLSSAQIADLEAWVKMGAPDPREGKAVVRKNDDGKNHWAYQPVKKPAVPAAANGAWARTPVDQFILAKLDEKGLKPNPAADRRTLIRRVYYDLIGLPPSPQEVQDFLSDTLDTAFAKVVDRLLAMPQYGERWGRHWLDVARYSDTKGEVRRQRETPNYPHAWTYRDYVVQSFNEDKPFNRFIIEQLAADKIPASATNKNLLAALGFITVGERFMGQQNDIINDRIDVVTKGFLGLTVSCARCHDHKFDPIPTKDYYSLHGVFVSSKEPEHFPILHMPKDGTAYADFYAKYTNVFHQITKVEEEARDLRRSRAEDKREKGRQLQREGIRLQNDRDRLEMTHEGAPSRAMVVNDLPRPQNSAVLVRGEAGNKGPVVPRQFLEILSGPNRRAFTNGSGRLDLAWAIASKDNPLTARVLVNRVWQHHFGEGFVPTPDDFGVMSTPPSHPELLDYLAARFAEEGWSVKRLHRLICNSAVYQQGSANQARAAGVDPQNRLLWRMNIQRLEFEPVRDSLLALAGRLDLTLGGRPIDLAASLNADRRSVYGRVDRQNLPEIMNHFDFANPDMPTGKRYLTTVPQQPLFFMNSPLVVEAAKALLTRTEFRVQTTDRGRVEALYELLYQRPPRAEELRIGVEFVAQEPSQERVTSVTQAAGKRGASLQRARELREKGDLKELAKMREEFKGRGRDREAAQPREPLNAWQEYAHALLQANEFIFVQ